MTRSKTLIAALLCCLAFVILGWLLLPYPGLQADEALFAIPIYPPKAWAGRVRMFHTDLPTMVMSYVGALKTYLYFAIYRVFPPTVFSTRLPMLLLSAGTVWLVFRTLLAAVGTRAALIGAALLATDPVFMMTSVFDWGPVAIQHFLIAAAMLGFLSFHRRPRLIVLAAASFALGLGLWDKASFAWLVAGIAAGALVAFPCQIRQHLRIATATTAAAALLIGALPVLIYNFQHRAATLQIGAGITGAEFEAKYQSLRDVLRGSGLYGYLSAEEATHPGRAPRTAVERISVALHNTVGHTRGNLGAVAFAAAAALAVVRFRRSPALRFLLVFTAVSWLAMLLVKGAGGSVHHTILLWPMTIMLVAVAVDRLGNRGALAATALLLAGNLIVYNEYLDSFTRYGSRAAWTNAIFPLAAKIEAAHPGEICLADWGMINQLRVIGRGAIRVNDVSFTLLSNGWSEPDRRALDQCVAAPLIVTHTAALEEFHGAREKLDGWARQRGLEARTIEVIADDLHRPVFEIFGYTARAAAKIQ